MIKHFIFDCTKGVVFKLLFNFYNNWINGLSLSTRNIRDYNFAVFIIIIFNTRLIKQNFKVFPFVQLIFIELQ